MHNRGVRLPTSPLYLPYLPTHFQTYHGPNAPKLCFVSCTVSTPILEPYLFRNYDYGSGRQSHHRGSCADPLWQALLASCAAPGYFEEVTIGPLVHQVGGVMLMVMTDDDGDMMAMMKIIYRRW